MSFSCKASSARLEPKNVGGVVPGQGVRAVLNQVEKKKFLLLLSRQPQPLEKNLKRHSRESAKWRIERSESVAAVIRAHEKFPPDLVIIDMAELSGQLGELLEHAKRRWPRTFFSLLTDQPAGDFQATFERYGTLPIIAPDSAVLVSRAIEKEMVGLVNGTLQGLLLSSFLQMMEWETKSVSIHVSAGPRWGRIHLSQGKFVSAYVHGLTLAPEEAAIEIMMWDNISISVERSYHNHPTDKLLALSSLIMDAMVRKDEAALNAPADEGEPPEDEPDGDEPDDPANAPEPDLTALGNLTTLGNSARPDESDADLLSTVERAARQMLGDQTLFDALEAATLDEDAFVSVSRASTAPPALNIDDAPDDDEIELYIIQNSVSVPSQQVQKKLLAKPNVRDVLITEVMSIDGALAAALVDHHSGMALEMVGAGVNLELAGAGTTGVVRAQHKAMTMLGIADGLEDMLVTLQTQYHLLYLLPGTSFFLYVILQKEQANVAMARYLLKSAAGSIRL